MIDKKKLYQLIQNYLNNNIDTKDFCDNFTTIYATEVDYSDLTNQEKELFGKLCKLTARFSPYEEDLRIARVYVGEKEILEKTNEIFNLLFQQ